MTQTDYTESIVTESLTLLTPYQVWTEFFLFLPRLRVFSFTVVQGLEPVFKFETKSLDNETTTPSPPSPSHFLILWFIIFRLLSFVLCLGNGIGNCLLDWIRLLFFLPLFFSLLVSCMLIEYLIITKQNDSYNKR